MKQARQIKTSSFLALNFLERKLGTNFMEQLGLQENNTEEFQMAYKFMKAAGQMDIWMSLVTNCENVFDVNRDHGSLPADWREIQTHFEEKLVDSLHYYVSKLVKEIARKPAGETLVRFTTHCLCYILAAFYRCISNMQVISLNWTLHDASRFG
jgi:uncharacterized protein YeaO (DUF488 family)